MPYKGITVGEAFGGAVRKGFPFETLSPSLDQGLASAAIDNFTHIQAETSVDLPSNGLVDAHLAGDEAAGENEGESHDDQPRRRPDKPATPCE